MFILIKKIGSNMLMCHYLPGCSTPQINTWKDNWIEFFAEHRLGYQVKLARRQFDDPIILELGM